MSEELKENDVVQNEVSTKFSWEISERGEINAADMSQLGAAMSAYRKAGLVPSHFKTNEIAIGAYLYCKNLGVDPLTNWGQVTNVNGKLAPFGTLFSALAQRDKDFGHDEIIFFDEKMEIICLENKNVKDPVFGCRIRTQKKGSPFIMESIFTMDDAKKANLIKNAWITYPKDLLMWKCIARNYRKLYPAALNGVMLAEDLLDSWDEKDVSPADRLNERLGLS